MVLGGFLATDPARCEKIVAAGFSIAAVLALVDRLRAGAAAGGAGRCSR